jgi:hypothetical protein
VAVKVDSCCKILVVCKVIGCHAAKIRLQTADFCDQAVNEEVRYQDLHLDAARR